MSNNKELKIIIKADSSNAEEELNNLGKELADVGREANKTGKEVEKLDKELGKTTQAIGKTGEEVEKTTKKFVAFDVYGNKITQTTWKAGRQFGTMSLEAQRAGAGIDAASRTTQQAERNFGLVGSASQALGNQIRNLRNDWDRYTLGINQTLDILEKAQRYFVAGWNFAEQGVALDESKEAHEAYTRSIGVNGDKMLRQLSQASGGTISQFNLIKTSSLAMSLGVTKDSDKMANLLEIARNKARLFGVGTQQAFEDIVTGVGRASPKILDNLGIRIPAAFEEMTDGMSDTEKVSKLFEMTLAEGNRQLEAMGPIIETRADKMRRLSASYEDLKASGGQFVFDMLEPEIKWLTETIRKTDELISVNGGLNSSFSNLVDTVEIAIGIFAGWKLAEMAMSIGRLALQIEWLTKAQAGFNMIVSANPWVIVASSIGGLIAYTRQLQGETDTLTAYTKAQIEQLKLMGPAGEKSALQLEISFKKTELAALGSLDAIDKRLDEISAKSEERKKRDQQYVYKQQILGRDDPGTFIDLTNRQDDREIAKLISRKAEISKIQREIKDKEAEIAGIKGNGYRPVVRSTVNTTSGTGTTGTGKKDKEEARLAAERLKDLTEALQKEANNQWKKLAQSIEDAALAPLPPIVAEYEKTGKAMFENLAAGFGAAAGAGIMPDIDYDFGQYLADDFEKVVTGAQEMQQAIDVASKRSVDSLMFLTTALPGSSAFQALVKAGGYSDLASRLPAELISKIRAEQVNAQLNDFHKQQYSLSIFTDPAENEKDKKDKKKLSNIVAEAVSTGFANADFSNFALTLGGILSQVLSNSVSQKFKILDTAGNVNWGNFGINVGTQLAISALTQPGRFFGGRQDKFKEQTLQAASDLKSQMGQAWVKSHETSLLPYLTEYDRNQLAAGRYSYNGTQTGYSWSDSGNGIWSDKTRTYNLIDQGASAALAKLTKAMENAEKYNRSVEMGYELQAAKGYDYQALAAQTAAFQQAAARAYGGEYSLNWSDGGKDTADLAEAAHEIKMAAAEMARQLGQATAERVATVATGFAKYAPWLNSIQTPANAPSNLRISKRGDGMFGDASSWQNFLQAPTTSGMDSLTISQQYDAFSALQTSLMDRNIPSYLLDMVKQAGTAGYELEELKLTDPELYTERYLEQIEKQMTALDEVMRRQEQIFNDAAKSYEERVSALDVYEQSMESYHQAKLDKLRTERQLEEQEKQIMAEARQAKMESALSLIGEVSQRGDRIMIIQAGDSTTAIKELMAEFADNPEVTAVLQSTLEKTEAQTRWGK